MKKIVIIGKTGLIGQRISQIITEQHLPYSIYAGGRYNTNEPNHYQIDVNNKSSLDCLKDSGIDLIILCTADKENNVLQFSIDNAINYLDITKPTSDLQMAYKIAEKNTIGSKIIFGSGWMGGIGGALIPSNIDITHLDFYIYYSLQDMSGKSSVDFLAENINYPFDIYNKNKPIPVKYFADPQKHLFNFGIGNKSVYNFDLPDLFILNKFRQIPTISSKITYNSVLVMLFLKICVSLGIFSILSTKTKKSIFRSTGKGDKTAFDICYTTEKKESYKTSIICSKGQAELTSYATVVHISKLFDMPNGIYFAHEMYKNFEIVDLLTKNKYVKIQTNR